MLGLLPISRFRVTYEVASGRPYSTFENLVLTAIGAGASSIQSLSAEFAVHQRLLIEALVTLTQAGWVAVGDSADSAFLLTADGESALGRGRLETQTIASRTTYVVMERLTGGIIAQREVTYVNRRALRDDWEHTVPLRELHGSLRVDEAEVVHLLPRRQGERVRWVGPIELDTKAANFLPIDVDISKRSVVGLPDVWTTRLHDVVLQGVAERLRRRTAMGLPAPAAGGISAQSLRKKRGARRDAQESEHTRRPTWRTRVAASDLISTAADHETYAITTLNEASDGWSVLISSSVVTKNGLTAARELLTEAANRGARVDVAAGAYENGALETLRGIARGVPTASERPIRFVAQPAESPSSAIVVYGPGVCRTCVGSYPWLGSPDPSIAYLSIEARVPALVGAVGRRLADEWAGIPSEGLAVTPGRWRHHAAELEIMPDDAGPEANAELSLLGPRDIEALVWSAIAGGHGAGLWTTHIRGDGGTLIRLLAEAQVREANTEVVVGSFGYSQAGAERIVEQAEEIGVSIVERSDNGRNLMIAADDALISSCGLLSNGWGPGGAPRGGLAIRVTSSDIAREMPVWLPDLGISA